MIHRTRGISEPFFQISAATKVCNRYTWCFYTSNMTERSYSNTVLEVLDESQNGPKDEEESLYGAQLEISHKIQACNFILDVGLVHLSEFICWATLFLLLGGVDWRATVIDFGKQSTFVGMLMRFT